MVSTFCHVKQAGDLFKNCSRLMLDQTILIVNMRAEFKRAEFKMVTQLNINFGPIKLIHLLLDLLLN